MSLPCCNEPPSCTWRPGDSEALRVALSLPVSAAALAALHREMAGLQLHYPTGVPSPAPGGGELRRQRCSCEPAGDERQRALFGGGEGEQPAEPQQPRRLSRAGAAGTPMRCW